MFSFIGKVIVVAMVSFLSYLCAGFVMTKLWGWFVVTTFGAQPLSGCGHGSYYGGGLSDQTGRR